MRACGGTITEDDDIPRVNHILAVTRALGDGALKPFVSGTPELSFADLDGSERFLVLATDGLWDVLAAAEVDACLRRAEVEGRSLEWACGQLVNQAVGRFSTDNVSDHAGGVSVRPTGTAHPSLRRSRSWSWTSDS